MLKSNLTIASAIFLMTLSACQSTTAKDTLSKYIEAFKDNNFVLQEKLSCGDNRYLEGKLDGIGDWRIVSIQHPDEKDGGVFFVQSGNQTWGVGVRKSERVYQTSLESAEKINAGRVRNQNITDAVDALVGEKSNDQLELIELPKRSDYSQESYCIVNIR